jgi:hypothetical protein
MGLRASPWLARSECNRGILLNVEIIMIISMTSFFMAKNPSTSSGLKNRPLLIFARGFID